MSTSCFPFRFQNLRALVVCAIMLVACCSVRAQEPSGAIRGVVTDAAQGLYLEGAIVTVEGSSQFAITDRRGEFSVSNLPSGQHVLVVDYTGMDSLRMQVNVPAGSTVTVAPELKENVVMMGNFTVTGNRDVDAIALTQQRNAPNIKNVVDVNSLGRLANDNPAELLVLLPGIAGNMFSGEVDRVMIRGVDSGLSNVELDGNRLSTPAINEAATNRAGILSTTNTNNIKTIEVIKALTPDRWADSIGGVVNLIQRSALDYPKSAGRFDYRAAAQYMQTRSAFEDKWDPIFQASYHDVFGPDRNIGIFLTGGFNREHPNQYNITQNRVNNATFGPIPTLLSNNESTRSRDRRNWAMTLDYRPSRETEFSFRYKHDQWFEETTSFVRQWASNVPLPTFTPELRTYRNATFRSNLSNNPADVFTDSLSFVAKHDWSDWHLTADVSYSRTIAKVAADSRESWGTVAAQLRPQDLAFTFEVDARGDFDRFINPLVRVTSGNEAAVFNPDNFVLPTYQQANFFTDDVASGAKVDLSRVFQLALPVSFKTGAAWLEQERTRRQRVTAHQFVGEDRVMGRNNATGVNDDRLSRFVLANPPVTATHNDVGNPFGHYWDLVAINRSYRNNPELWSDNVYNNTANRLENNFVVNEAVTAAYVMAETDWRRVHLAGGVRFERTEVEGTGVFPDPTPATPAEIPDPEQRAISDFGDTITRTSTYDDLFPSLHAVYSVTKDFLVRASYSTGIGRPAYGSVIPTTTISEAAERITTNNTGVRPQYSNSFDLSLEYYIEPAGIISVGVFTKDIRDFITRYTDTVTDENQFGPQYVGYTLVTNSNGGSAEIRGLEFNYIQQLNFIPRSFGLFTLKANATILHTEGDFGGEQTVSTSQVPGFVPKTWSVIGQYSRGRFGGLVRYNWQARSLNTLSANTDLSNYIDRHEKIDINLYYRWRPECEFFVSVDNVTNTDSVRTIGEHQPWGAGQVFAGQRRWNIGIQGKF